MSTDDWVDVPCGLCGAARGSVFSEGVAPSGLPFRLVKCGACQLVYLSPRPPDTQLMNYYPRDYMPHAPFPEHLTLRDRLKWLVLTRHQPGSTWLQRAGQGSANLLLRPLIGQVIDFVPGGRILDVGCGNGWNVRLYQAAGWEAYGVEPNATAVANARSRGLNVVAGSVLEAGFRADFFDAITMYQVLEHVASPRDLLRECGRILKPGGRCVVSVPNIECYDQSLFQADWIPLDVPRHLYHYSIATLPKMLVAAGFRVDRVKAQYLTFSSTWNDYRRLVGRLRSGVHLGSVRAVELLKSAVIVGARGFLAKPFRLVASSNRASEFAYYLHAYATKP